MLRQGNDFLRVLLELSPSDLMRVMSIWVSAGFVVADWVDMPFDSPWTPGPVDMDAMD